MTANSSVKRGRVNIVIKCNAIETSAKCIQFGRCYSAFMLSSGVHYSFEVKEEFYGTWNKITQKSILKIC